MSAAFIRGGAKDYRAHLDSDPTVPLWQQPWWLTATTGEAWDSITLHSGGHMVAALPYVQAKRAGIRLWSQPPLTQGLGPWMEEASGKYVKRLSREHALLSALADEVPDDVYYLQNWVTDRQNWLPFYWRGFQQTTRYTYRLDLTRGRDYLWSAMSDDTRNAIRRAEGRYGVVAQTSSDVDSFIGLNKQVFRRQRLDAPHPPELLKRVHSAVRARDAGRLVVARENDGTPSAAALIVRGGSVSHYLMGGAHSQLRRSGSQTLALWEAITGEIGRSHWFDFEGSMIEPIERSFRAFGAIQTPYLRVSGSHSPWIRRAVRLREALGSH